MTPCYIYTMYCESLYTTLWNICVIERVWNVQLVTSLLCVCSCRTDLNDASQRAAAAQKQLRDLQGSRQDKLKLFGAWQPELRQKIEGAVRQRKFHREPIGPIGTYLTCT